MKTIQVWFHSGCYDGFGSAFAAWKAYGDDAEYIPCSYGNPPPDVTGAGFVYILDFSFKKDVMIELCLKHPDTQFVIIDHHKTAEADLKDLGLSKPKNLDVHFRMDQSGALMTWYYFNTNEHGQCPEAPLFFRLLSDRDLWTYKLPGTREHHAALGSYPFDFKVWETLVDNCTGLIAEGAALRRQQTVAVNKICDKHWIGDVDDYSVPVVNTSVHWSEVGEELLKRNPEYPFAASFTRFENTIMWSLRSRLTDPEGGFDVSALAKKYGGGGHRNAAGFSAIIP